jgi:hypothetical protein
LKVTEKDVLAEEMYEEEEDELPAQYKNLNAHLQTGSSDFDARLQAYLANAVAFRKALSGVYKPGDKSKQADFVNKKQLADHTSLFPKHSDAWKNIVIPKCGNSRSSAFLPQGSTYAEFSSHAPYDSKLSGLSNRRTSAGCKPEELNHMGTLRPSDLKTHPTVYRPSPQHPIRSKLPLVPQRVKSVQVTEPELYSNGINYDALDFKAPDNVDYSPFTSQLPANAIDMLMPWKYSSPTYEKQASKYGYEHALSQENPLEQKVENSINATLIAPRHDLPITQVNGMVQNTLWNPSAWDEAQINDSASRKLMENDMWGSFIEENPMTVWEWDKETAV